MDEGVFDFGLYAFFFWIQLTSYAAAFLGWILKNKRVKVKVLFIPYYFLMMNLSVVLGFFRYLNNEQSVNWERAKRAV